MPRSPLCALLAVLVAALVAPASASAAFFPPDVIDGPSPDVLSVGGVDEARDGTGAVIYVKRDGGVAHIFASRLLAGVWQPPERLDPNLLTPSGEPVIAAANGGRLVAAFTNGGQLYTVFHAAGATSWALPAPLAATPAATPSIDMSTNGVGYVVWSASGDVGAAYMPRTATAFTPLAAPVDIDPNADAGSGTGRPQVTAPADGTADVVWGEGGHVYLRRLLGLTPSAFPQDATAPTLAGHPGGTADLPVVDAPDDSSFAWIAFREQFDNGATTRVVTRRFAGSMFDAPFDGGGGGFGVEGTDEPAVDASGGNDVVFASDTTTSHTPFGQLYYAERYGAPFQVGPASAIATDPKVAIGESSSTVIAWLRADAAGAPVSVHARSFKQGKPVGVEATISNSDFGSVDTGAGFFAAADKAGDTAIPYIEVDGTARRLVASTWDRPPANLIVITSTHWHNWPTIRWLPASEYWGAIAYRVVIDGRTIGTFNQPRFAPKGLIADGTHRFQVLATDIRGQVEASPPRTLRLDTRPPSLKFKIAGRKVAGSTLTLIARAKDPGNAHTSSQLSYVKIDWGDGSPAAMGRKVRHVFTSGGFTITVSAHDSAGNVTTLTRSITVR